MASLKYSRQREAVKNFLMTRKDHPTADVVYSNIRQEFPHISLGTVYRNLTLLSDMGEIRRLHFGTGVDHFDADISAHYHFVCQDCGSVIDLAVENLDAMNQFSPMGFDGQIAGHVAYFYGLCGNCCQKRAH